MNSRLLATTALRAAKIDQRIPPIAGTIFGVFLIISILGAILMDGKQPDPLIGGWVVGWMLIGTYVLSR